MRRTSICNLCSSNIHIHTSPSFLPCCYSTGCNSTRLSQIVPDCIIGIGRLPHIAVHCCTLPYIAIYYYTYASINWVANIVYSTYSTVFNLIWFISISHLRANNNLLLVIASAGLLSLLIHLTLAISRLLYDWRRHIISIINLFSCVVFSLIRYL